MLKIWFLTFFDKEKYVLHYDNLQIHLRLKKLRGVLEFNQSQWLKPYVEFNVQKKNRSRNKCRQR